MSMIQKVGRMTYAEYRKHRPRKVVVPELLIGCWSGVVPNMELTGGGERFSLVEGDFSVSGNQLSWQRRTYQRYSGSGPTVVGGWRGTFDGYTEELTFSEDGSYQIKWVEDNMVFPGTYAINGNYMKVRELSQTFTATDTRIIFKPLYDPEIQANYTVSETELHLVFDHGEQLNYTRRAC